MWLMTEGARSEKMFLLGLLLAISRPALTFADSVNMK